MEVYVDGKSFLLKFNPKQPKIGGLIPLNTPELFITDKLTAHLYPEGFQSHVPDKVSFRCDLLLTNPTHEGLWLFTDHDKKKTSFLGGFITPEDWKYAVKNPYYVILSTINRSMIENHPICKYSIGIDPMLQMSVKPTLAEFMDVFQYLIRQYKFNINQLDSGGQVPMPMYYQYYLYPHHGIKENLDSMRIYALVEVDDPVTRIPALTNYTHGDFIWYSRRDHKFNLNARTDRAALFQADYENDLRVTESGFDILDNIFLTSSIFGKLDIY